MLVAVLMIVGFVDAAADPDATRATTAGYALLLGLTGLALAEHVFMLVPLPIERLWRWSTRASRDAAPDRADASPTRIVPTRT